MPFASGARNDCVLDPTCGSGTFLLRAYDRLSFFGQRNHRDLLNQLWGVDIAHFPAELATINLYRQNVADFANFPRIVCKDFFEVKLGDIFEFPSSEPETELIVSEKLPVFDAAVGNFPYIRQELIEKSVTGYKENLQCVLREDWLADYPQFFERGGIPRLSGQADIYAYLFFHTARFIREGGRMGFVTSNAWLDVAYGYELQKFILKNFKIIAILESRCEPWFEQSAVNTVVTILERCSDKEERDQHLVKFVKVKRKLRDLIPWDMKRDAINRWSGVDKLVRKIKEIGCECLQIIDGNVVDTLKGHKTYEDWDFRIRVKSQAQLLEELETTGKTVKWGVYLRAPEVYFEIVEKCKDKLVPLKELANIKRGYTTGINEFFYLTEDKIKKWGVEGDFLAPVLKSPKESEGILIDSTKLKMKVFFCQKSKEELLKERKSGALRYIEWGEKQKTAEGIPWPEVSTVKNRKPGWWALQAWDVPHYFWSDAYNERFVCFMNEPKVFADKRLFYIHLKEEKVHRLLATYLNSSLVPLFIELQGITNLGEGAIYTNVYQLAELPIFDPKKVNSNATKALGDALEKLSHRPIKPVFDEVKMPDRRRLDSLVLEAIGLDPKEYLQPLYEGLTQLVRERLELGRMRGAIKKVRAERDVQKIKRQVMEEILPQGVLKFPEDFLEPLAQKGGFFELDIPEEPLKVEPVFFGKQKVVSDSGWCYEAKSPAEAKFILYAQKEGHAKVSIPKEPIVLFKTVANYERYLRGLKKDLSDAFSIRIFDHKQAGILTQAVFEELELPEVEEG